MDQKKLKNKIETLRDEIRHHEYMYFVKAEPEISDQAFDKLMNELIKLEEANPELITPDSPTQRVGEAVTSFNTAKHRIPMLSIENSYSIAGITDWIQKMEKLAGRSIWPVVAELKIDGVSGSFTYRNGSFVSGATRGNGVQGDLISENAKTIRSLPLKIKSDLDMDIRGEIFTPRSQLVKLNKDRRERGLELFKNCRNLTAGTIKSLDPAIAAKRGLQVMVYGIAQAKELKFKSHSETLRFLKEQGFKLNYAYKVCNSSDEVKTFIDRINEERKSFDFDIDGIVLKVDNLAIQEELGITSKAPRWAIAYKYPQETAVARLVSVSWQVGRSQLTPVAHLEPVQLGGTTVSRASLHNIDQIKEKDIRQGDFVVVEKAGYIIPYIVKTLPEKRDGNEIEIKPPQQCPSCGGSVKVTESRDNSTAIVCENKNCQGVAERKIQHFITQMEIENIGPQLVRQLLEKKLVTSFEDVLALDVEQLMKLERIGEKSANKIFKNIQKAKKAPLSRVIAALGISNVGIVVAEKIAEFFDQSLEAFVNADKESLMQIEGISDKVADNIIAFCNSETVLSSVDSIKQWWQGPDNQTYQNSDKKDILGGKIFVVTGEASVPRKKLEKLIKECGGAVKSSVSTKTDFLLIGSGESDDFNSSKKRQAQKLNKTIISEFDLFKMVGTNLETIKNNG
ncbi:MAG: NAD-dependent DNA ligase LigA [Candidatus Rifleibacteriota bacterium]